METAGEIVGLVHDLGKYSGQFQAYIEADQRKASRGSVDHSTAGSQLLMRDLPKESLRDRMIAEFLALCVASHHGGLIDCLTPEGSNALSERLAKPEENTHIEEAFRKADIHILKRYAELLGVPSLVSSIGKSLEAICYAERSRYGDGKEIRFRFNAGLLLRMLFSCLVDGDHTDAANFAKPGSARHRAQGEYPTWDPLILKLEQRLQAFKLRHPVDHIRRQVSEACRNASQRRKGLFTLTVPTGGGKTLASLRFALHHACKWSLDKIVYVVPYTTIIDQNVQETRGILEPAEYPEDFSSVVLEHHSNILPENETEKSRVLAENWDAPLIYTTMVQFLETLFGAGTRSARRMHQLANAVLVFDEIQALPVKTVHMFCNAINFLVDHCGSSVVLCTATQPLLDRVDATRGALTLPAGGEIIPDVATLYTNLKRVDVRDHRRAVGWRNEEIVELAFAGVKETGSCLIIVNTKRSALALYQLCKAHGSDADICHLSTYMCPQHRRAILARIELRIGKNGDPPKDPGPLLCISTQLIEAGIDVDFGSVIRFVAGLDSIAQAAGRCNRNGRRVNGPVWIVNPSQESLKHLEDIRAGKAAAIRVLGEFADCPISMDDLLSPKTMETYFTYYFFDRKHLMGYPVQLERDDTLLNMLSLNTFAVEEYKRIHRSAPDTVWRQSFKTAARAFKAIEAATRGVIVPYGREGQELIGSLSGATDPAEWRTLLQHAQRYSVSVFPWVLDKLRDVGAVREVQKETGILHLSPAHYSEEFGLSLEAVSDLPFLNA
jgi:CRISPR-associated endonuclease/helicase Cas3